MELTQQEHSDLNSVYKALADVRSDILARTFGDRRKVAEAIHNQQGVAIADYFKRKKANIDILGIKGYAEYYHSPKIERGGISVITNVDMVNT